MLLFRFALVCAVLLAATSQAVAGPPPVFVVSGGGYGHGVGMSQWGAYGQAKAGRTYEQILAHYYRGTTLGRTSGRAVRVLLVDRAQAVKVSSDAPFVTTDPRAGRVEHEAGEIALTAAGLPAASEVTITSAGGAQLRVAGRLYRGSLRAIVADGALQVINVVPLEQYLRSVVAGEVPSSWPAAALQAQAVAARTYVLAKTITSEPYDVYADTRSQVYGGASTETPEASAAVAATALQVLLYQGQPAATFYFASSGGRTASAADIFALDLPYLSAVTDPWDTLSPDHAWKPIRLTAARVRRALALPSAVVGVATRSAHSGHPIAVELTLRNGAAVEIPGSEFRTALALRSTRFSVGQLALAGSTPTIAFGSRLRLTGTAADVEQPTLEARTAGGTWEVVARIRRGRAGTFSALVRPRRETSYRLVGSGVVGPRLAVGVSPRVRLLVRRSAGRAVGRVTPSLPGARIAVERLRARRWRPVAQVTVAENGTFTAPVRVGSGSYRAVVASVPGFTDGVSQVVVVG